jgi:hypothetical protein
VVLRRVKERLRIVRRFVRTFFEYEIIQSILCIEIGVPFVHFEAIQIVEVWC